MPKHLINKDSNHSIEQLYSLVKDIEKYPEFIPWCSAARILENHKDYLIAELVIGYKGIMEKYSSKVTFFEPSNNEAAIKVEMLQGPFNYLINNWYFKATPLGCNIDFFIDFTFKAKLLEKLLGNFFEKAVCKMVNAFELRADNLFPTAKIS